SASYTFTLNGNRNLVANFKADLYTVTLSASPNTGGTPSGGGTFQVGSSVTVVAAPNAGYGFVNWTENGSAVSSSASYTFTLNGNRNLVANFNVPSDLAVQIGNVTASAGAGAVVPITLERGTGKENAVSFSILFPTSQVTFGRVALGTGTTGASLFVNDQQANNGFVGVVISMPANQSISAGTAQLVLVTLNVATGLTAGTVIPIKFASNPASQSVSDSLGNDEQAAWIDGDITIGVAGFEGDVAGRPNGNGLNNAADVTVMNRIVAGLESSLSSGEFQRADCAPRSTLGNGTISAADLTQVNRYVAGLDPQTPVGGPTGPAAISILAQRSSKLEPQSANPSRLSLGSIAAAPGSVAVVGVQVSALGDENALSFSIQFDPAKVTFESGALGTGGAAGSLVVNPDKSVQGKVGFVISLPVNQSLAPGNLELLKLNFTIAGTASGTIPIIFGNDPAPISASDALGNDLPVESVNGAIVVETGGPTPVITSQPANLILSADGEAVFSVTATGAETYQWFFNGNEIPNATGARLTLPNLTPASTGLYTVKVTNKAGSVTSAPAVLGLFGDIKMYAGVSLVGPAGTRFRIEFSDAVGEGGPWQTLMTVTLENSSGLVVDPDSPKHAHRYYRAIIEQ
ncbi:MAG: cohesin domain-containing protein, partial [Verrucomicrobiales bacterium]|nr:cohesin domain-containing protein [Verrucomicrobiales bacterium]